MGIFGIRNVFFVLTRSPIEADMKKYPIFSGKYVKWIIFIAINKNGILL